MNESILPSEPLFDFGPHRFSAQEHDFIISLLRRDYHFQIVLVVAIEAVRLVMQFKVTKLKFLSYVDESFNPSI